MDFEPLRQRTLPMQCFSKCFSVDMQNHDHESVFLISRASRAY